MILEELAQTLLSIVLLLLIVGLPIGFLIHLRRGGGFGGLDLFVPMLRPTRSQVEVKMDVLRSECARLTEENEKLKKRLQIAESSMRDH